MQSRAVLAARPRAARPRLVRPRVRGRVAGLPAVRGVNMFFSLRRIERQRRPPPIPRTAAQPRGRASMTGKARERSPARLFPRRFASHDCDFDRWTRIDECLLRKFQLDLRAQWWEWGSYRPLRGNAQDRHNRTPRSRQFLTAAWWKYRFIYLRFDRLADVIVSALRLERLALDHDARE